MTTVAVPSKDPVDFLLNVESLDKCINSGELTFTDRLGQVKPTLLGTEIAIAAKLAHFEAVRAEAIDVTIPAKIAAVEARKVTAIAVDIPAAIATVAAINNRGAWAATTSYALKDIVLTGGTWYVCVVAHTSSAAFATDTASKWRVYQGVIYSDIASPSGSFAHNVYAESESGRTAKMLLTAAHGTHTGAQQISVFGIEHRPTGGGSNGAENADIGANISVIKHNYLTSSAQGEIDGLNIVVRQGGPTGNGSTTNSDAAGILVDAGMLSGAGFIAAFEAGSSIFDSSGVTTKKVQTQVGVLDSTTSTYIGFAAIAQVGMIDDGIRLLSSGTGYFTNFMTFYNTAGTNVFRVDNSGRITLTANSGATPSKTIRALSGQLSILNHAQSAQILVLDDTGNLSTPGGYTSAGAVTAVQFIATTAATTASAGTIRYGSTTATNVGAAGGAASLPATPLGYIIANISGVGVKIPYYNS